MSNTKLNCCKCGKEFGFTERIYTCGDLWQCEDCAIKQMQENDDKGKIIADLEAKLTDTEFRYENLHNLYYKDTEELKQQLAEKEEEIKQLNNRIIFSQLQAPKEQILNILGSQCIQYNPDQDKISFAVEQLTEIREYVKECWGLDELEGKVRLDIAKKIRLKIEQLKEMK